MPSRAALCFTRGSVLAVRTATRASSSARARRLRPPTAALRLCCLLAGQPLCHHERPEAAFLWRVRQDGVEQLTAGRRPASSDDGRSKSSADSQLANAGLPTNPKPALAAARGSSVFTGARGRALDECLPRFFHAAISSRSRGLASPPAASAKTVKQWLLQRGVFVLHLGVEHESRSIAALTAAAQQKR